MAKSVNKVILIGNLGKDPEVKYTPQGTPVAKITLATNERFKDKSGAWQDRTEWHNVVLWQRLAEIAGEYLKKGGKVYIEGRLQTRSWDDKQTNQKKYMTEVVANDLVLLGGRGEAGGGGEGHGGGSRGAANHFDQSAPEPRTCWSIAHHRRRHSLLVLRLIASGQIRIVRVALLPSRNRGVRFLPVYEVTAIPFMPEPQAVS